MTPNPTIMLRFHILFIVLLLAAFPFSSCSNRQTALILNDVESYIQDRPDSALATIRAIDTTTLTSRSLRAHYALLHAMALDKNWIDTTDISIVMPAVEYYDRHPSDVRRAKAWYYLGRIQENRGDIPSANISFLKSEKWAIGKADEYFMSLIWQSLSNTYSKSYLNEEALLYSERSFQSSARMRDTLGMNASRYRMAQDLNNLHRYTEADSLYRILVSIDNSSISSHLYPSLISDYALLRLQHYDDYGTAVRLFGEAIEKSGYLRNHNLWGAYAYALLRNGYSDFSDNIFKQLEFVDDSNSLAIKTWLARAEAYAGNFASAYERITLASNIQQENVAHILKQSALRAQMTYREQENDAAKKMMVRRIIVLVTSLLLLLFIAFGIIVYLKRRNKRIASEQELMLDSFRSLSADYNRVRDNQAAIRAKYIAMFQTHFGQTGQINYLLLHSTKEKDTVLYQELKKAVMSIRTDAESQQQFEMILNESLDNIMVHFRETFPGKKSRYYQIASFLFAGFDATIISNIVHDLSKDNVYVEKSRIKKLIRETNSPYREQFLSLL